MSGNVRSLTLSATAATAHLAPVPAGPAASAHLAPVPAGAAPSAETRKSNPEAAQAAQQLAELIQSLNKTLSQESIEFLTFKEGRNLARLSLINMAFGVTQVSLRTLRAFLADYKETSQQKFASAFEGLFKQANVESSVRKRLNTLLSTLSKVDQLNKQNKFDGMRLSLLLGKRSPIRVTPEALQAISQLTVELTQHFEPLWATMSKELEAEIQTYRGLSNEPNEFFVKEDYSRGQYFYNVAMRHLCRMQAYTRARIPRLKVHCLRLTRTEPMHYDAVLLLGQRCLRGIGLNAQRLVEEGVLHECFKELLCGVPANSLEAQETLKRHHELCKAQIAKTLEEIGKMITTFLEEINKPVGPSPCGATLAVKRGEEIQFVSVAGVYSNVDRVTKEGLEQFYNLMEQRIQEGVKDFEAYERDSKLLDSRLAALEKEISGVANGSQRIGGPEVFKFVSEKISAYAYLKYVSLLRDIKDNIQKYSAAIDISMRPAYALNAAWYSKAIQALKELALPRFAKLARATTRSNYVVCSEALKFIVGSFNFWSTGVKVFAGESIEKTRGLTRATARDGYKSAVGADSHRKVRISHSLQAATMNDTLGKVKAFAASVSIVCQDALALVSTCRQDLPRMIEERTAKANDWLKMLELEEEQADQQLRDLLNERERKRLEQEAKQAVNTQVPATDATAAAAACAQIAPAAAQRIAPYQSKMANYLFSCRNEVAQWHGVPLDPVLPSRVRLAHLSFDQLTVCERLYAHDNLAMVFEMLSLTRHPEERNLIIQRILLWGYLLLEAGSTYEFLSRRPNAYLQHNLKALSEFAKIAEDNKWRCEASEGSPQIRYPFSFEEDNFLLRHMRGTDAVTTDEFFAKAKTWLRDLTRFEVSVLSSRTNSTAQQAVLDRIQAHWQAYEKGETAKAKAELEHAALSDENVGRILNLEREFGEALKALNERISSLADSNSKNSLRSVQAQLRNLHRSVNLLKSFPNQRHMHEILHSCCFYTQYVVRNLSFYLSQKQQDEWFTDDLETYAKEYHLGHDLGDLQSTFEAILVNKGFEYIYRYFARLNDSEQPSPLMSLLSDLALRSREAVFLGESAVPSEMREKSAASLQDNVVTWACRLSLLAAKLVKNHVR